MSRPGFIDRGAFILLVCKRRWDYSAPVAFRLAAFAFVAGQLFAPLGSNIVLLLRSQGEDR
jgi:hypothetical protein